MASFRADNNLGSQVMTSGPAKILYPNVVWDIGGYYNRGLSSWTPPAGKVRIGGQVYIPDSNLSPDLGQVISIYKNGSVFANFLLTCEGTLIGPMPVWADDDANGTDVYDIRITANFSSSLTFNTSYVNTFFWGYTLPAGAISFKANNGGTSQSGLTTSVDAQVTLGTELWDVGGFFSAGAWTPPAGYVSMLASTRLSAATLNINSGVAIYIYKNGSRYKGVFWGGGNANAMGLNIAIDDICNGSDVYKLFAIAFPTGTWTIAGAAEDTYFSGYVLPTS